MEPAKKVKGGLFEEFIDRIHILLSEKFSQYGTFKSSYGYSLTRVFKCVHEGISQLLAVLSRYIILTLKNSVLNNFSGPNTC